MSAAVARLSRKLDEREAVVKRWEDRYLGNSPLTFLSPEAKQALQNRLSALSVNFCRLAVDALAERLKVTGFVIDGVADADLWRRWREQGGPIHTAQAITDALMSGQGWLSVWGASGSPVVRAEPATGCIVERDPMTGLPLRGLKRWTAEDRAHAVLYALDRLTILQSKTHVPEGGVVPPDGWTTVDVLPNPLGMLPLIPLVNRGRTTDVYGVSEMAAIADLNDALQKVLVDAMVTSEDFARPRRWASGLEIVEDDEGNPVDPFPDKSKKLWQSESEETRFGQFDQADLNSYSGLTDSLLSQISALSGLPSHYVFSKLSPSNGEEVRAKEISLVARAEAKIENFTLALSEVARLMVAIRDDSDPARISVEPVWADPSSRTVAQEADAVYKLASGERPILPLRQARQRLGYSLSEIAEMEKQDAAEQAVRMAANF